MVYTAEPAEVKDRLGEVTDWFSARSLPLGAFRYRMGPEIVRLRVDFGELREAAKFAEAFRGVVLGVSPEAESAA
jgi:hypothetical protein